MRFATGSARLPLVAFVVAVIVTPDPAAAWRVRVQGSSTAGPVASDPRGDVLAAIGLPVRRHQSGVAIVKLAARDGAELWRRRLHGAGRERSDFINGIRIAGADVVGAGEVDDGGFPALFVTRLSGRDGAPRWQTIVHGGGTDKLARASAVAVDPDGDVIVAGAVDGTSALYHSMENLAVLKLAGATGEELWRFTFDGSADQGDYATALALDAAGDAIAVGTTARIAANLVGEEDVVSVFKLAGADGHVRWQHDFDDAWRADSIAVDDRDDVVVAVSTREPSGFNDFGVFKLRGATGDVAWEARVSRSADHWQEARQALPLPSGDVGAVGFVVDPTGSPLFASVVLDGRTGAGRWVRLLHGSAGVFGGGQALAITRKGRMVVGGQVRNRGSCYDIAVAELAASTGDVLSRRMLDGLSRASQCDRPTCFKEHGRCGPPDAGIDRDTLTALTTDAHGRIILAGALSDGPHGQQHGLVATLRPGR